MNKHWSVLLITAFSILTCCALAGTGETEHQRAKTAEKLFLAKQYEKACPLYAQLISSDPKFYKYNYYYGICLLISGKDKSACLPYLETAIQSPKTPEDIYYYMGRAMHLNYRFEEAMKCFVEFSRIVGPKNAPKWQISQMMEMVNYAKQQLDTTKNITITEKTDCAAYDFFSKYQFTAACGKMLTMPDEIIKTTKSDEDEKPMIFLSANGRVMYYAAMSNETSSRDIFRMEKDLNGNWLTPVRLTTPVNGPQDELLPTCNADGRILYFSSRGHGSTGGFDIFKTYYNMVTKTWTTPVNMGSPYNSPDDDFCFSASTQEQTAYVTTQRETGPGSLSVFKIAYTDPETLPVAINGRFHCIGQPDLTQMNLQIEKADNTATLAYINTDSTGSYLVELPGPGIYKFTVSSPGFSTHTQMVQFNEFSDNIFVQDIYLSRNVNGGEDLSISNRRLSEANFLDNATAAVTPPETTTDVTAPLITSTELPDGTTGKGKTNTTNTSSGTANTTTGTAAANGTTQSERTARLNGGTDAVTTNERIEFRVQIGAFRRVKKETVQQRLSKKADTQLMSDMQDKTWLRFFMGHETNYDSAKNLRNMLRQAGFKDAFIVAMRSGKTMNLSQAITEAKTEQ